MSLISAKLKVKHIIRHVVKYTECGTRNSANNVPVIIKAGVPKPVLPHSMASSSVAAQIIYQKYKMGMPLNRQETDWFRMGLVLPGSDMAHWVIRTSGEWFKPIYDEIRNRLIRCDVLHMDETGIQATYFSYSPNRRIDIAGMLAGDYDGFLITDAYSGYNKAGNYERCLC